MNAISCLLEVLQLVSKAYAVCPSCSLCPVQEQGQQLVLGQMGNRFWAQIVHARPSLSLQGKLAVFYDTDQTTVAAEWQP